jgi:hypothetical protein
MPDDLLNRGPADRTRINVNEKHEVRYWCGALNCTEDQLREAVRRVGTMAEDIRRAVRSRSS